MQSQFILHVDGKCLPWVIVTLIWTGKGPFIKKPIDRIRDDYKHTDKVQGLVWTGDGTPCTKLECNCLLLHSASRAPSIDRYMSEIRPQPLTSTFDLNLNLRRVRSIPVGSRVTFFTSFLYGGHFFQGIHFQR